MAGLDPANFCWLAAIASSASTTKGAQALPARAE
jgi:hypothetical protein